MRPLHIVCQLVTGAILPSEGCLHLDGLLAAAWCMREGITATTAAELIDVEIPVQRSASGSYHMASALLYEREQRELRWMNKRFPTDHALAFGDAKLKRVSMSSGVQKAFRIPTERTHVLHDRLEAWCIGEREAVTDLLSIVTRIGRRRSVGEGLVRSWMVEECEPWGDGFPVIRDGQPLRNLPASDELGGSRRYGRLTYPYWLRTDEMEIACP